MGPWKVGQPSLQLEFLIHFTFTPYSMDHCSLASFSTLHMDMLSQGYQ